MMPKIRFAAATMALPVPLSFVGNSSGERAYSTPYMMLDVKLYPQFHPKRALDVRAVVLTNKNTPVNIVLMESVPFRPRYGSSINQPAIKAPGIPMTLRMTCYLRTVRTDVS